MTHCLRSSHRKSGRYGECLERLLKRTSKELKDFEVSNWVERAKAHSRQQVRYYKATHAEVVHFLFHHFPATITGKK